MRRLSTLLALCLITVSAWAATPTGPAVGDKAPDFKLQDQKGEWHTLDTEKGKGLVVYFYGRRDTVLKPDLVVFQNADLVLENVNGVLQALVLAHDIVDAHLAFVVRLGPRRLVD